MRIASNLRDFLQSKVPFYIIDEGNVLEIIEVTRNYYYYKENNIILKKKMNVINTTFVYDNKRDAEIKILKQKAEFIKGSFPAVEKHYLEMKDFMGKHPEYFVF